VLHFKLVWSTHRRSGYAWGAAAPTSRPARCSSARSGVSRTGDLRPAPHGLHPPAASCSWQDRIGPGRGPYVPGPPGRRVASLGHAGRAGVPEARPGDPPKWAQRDEARRRGLRLVTWTFDPMRASNARLNLRHLGAVAREVLPDFYGTTSSALHHGLATDRLLARWELESDRVKPLRRRRPAPVAAPPARASTTWRQAGWAVSTEPRLDLMRPTCCWRSRVERPPGGASRGRGLARQGPARPQTYLSRGFMAADFAPGRGRAAPAPLRAPPAPAALQRLLTSGRYPARPREPVTPHAPRRRSPRGQF
jgi:hypothetical protein